MHISKPWWEEGLLIVNAVNSTAGLFAGDAIDIAIEVKSGAEMLVTSASASRVHRTLTGKATVRQEIRVARDGWLEMLPALFIPHAGSNYSQDTSIYLEPGSRFLWFETIAPGRVAFGEAWQFTRFESRFRLACGSRPVVRETYSLTPDSASAAAVRRQFSAAYHATCYASGADFSDDLLAAISALHHSECWVGCTRLDAPAIAIRLVAADNPHLTRVLTKIRELLYQAFGRTLPALRRA
jgi:urease accessory protein